MRHKIYAVTLEVEDKSDSDGEDLELWIEDTLREGLPESIEIHIVNFEEVEDEGY